MKVRDRWRTIRVRGNEVNDLIIKGRKEEDEEGGKGRGGGGGKIIMFVS